MPAPAQAPDPACLSQRGEVLDEAWDGLVRGERSVGEPRRDVCLLDERVGEARRVGRQREDDADRGDGEHAQPERDGRHEGLDRDPQRPDRDQLRGVRVVVARGEDEVEERDPERGQPERQDAASEQPGG